MRNKNGFLLAEALIGLCILALGVGGALQIFLMARNLSQTSEKKRLAAEVAENTWLQLVTGQTIKPTIQEGVLALSSEERWLGAEMPFLNLHVCWEPRRDKNCEDFLAAVY